MASQQPGLGEPRLASGTGSGTVVRVAGELLITAGLVVLLYMVYELYVTGIVTAQRQAQATQALEHQWKADTGQHRVNQYDLTSGNGVAEMYIPALGAGYRETVVQGTAADDLAIGPGHYVGTALPGQPGNFAVAGHRTTHTAPFTNIDRLRSCDAIIVETQSDWYVYRVLPTASEATGWATGWGRAPQCAGADGESPVQPLTGPYARTVGQEIVLPTQTDVVAPVPHDAQADLPPSQEASLLTLTTCNPKFSANQRLIVHAVLTKTWPKTGDLGTPIPELAEANQAPS